MGLWAPDVRTDISNSWEGATQSPSWTPEGLEPRGLSFPDGDRGATWASFGPVCRCEDQWTQIRAGEKGGLDFPV